MAAGVHSTRPAVFSISSEQEHSHCESLSFCDFVTRPASFANTVKAIPKNYSEVLSNAALH